MTDEQTEEEKREIADIEKGKKQFEKLLIWLTDADIDFEVKTWDSGEGKDIIVEGYNEKLDSLYLTDEEKEVEKKKSRKVVFSFRDNGYIRIESEVEE